MSLIQCLTCDVEIILNHKWYREGTHATHKTRFCSPQCKFISIFSGRDPEGCWFYAKKCLVMGTRVYSIKALSYSVHHKEDVSPDDIIIICGSRFCANPRHMRRKEDGPPRQVKDYYRSCL